MGRRRLPARVPLMSVIPAAGRREMEGAGHHQHYRFPAGQPTHQSWTAAASQVQVLSSHCGPVSTPEAGRPLKCR
eukprot:10295313-Alexandrium_andersonii.AAC.1